MAQFDSGRPDQQKQKDMERKNLIAEPSGDYELLDSGGGEKLEKYGEFVLVRPDPQVLWEKGRESLWANANGRYRREGKDGVWEGSLSKEWQVLYGGFTFNIRPTSFKHTGLFPEQLQNWEWISSLLRKSLGSAKFEGSPTPPPNDFAPKVLNLFAYTGGATLAAVRAGAQVTHVDASKVAVAWARENAASSGLVEAPVRWITEDVLTFVKREIKRGVRYDAIIMDPPAFGHGPEGELWKIEDDFLELMKLCSELLSDNPLFVCVSGYAAGYSPLAFGYNLEMFVKKFGGAVEYGDLSIKEKGSDRILPCGIFARWQK